MSEYLNRAPGALSWRYMTRRELLAGAASARMLWAKKRLDRSRISAITDEIGMSTDESIAFAKEYGIQWVELRRVPEAKKDYTSLTEPELKAAAATLRNHGLRVSFLDASLMKFAWPGTDPVRKKPESDAARNKRLAADAQKFERRMEDLKTAISVAQIVGTDKVRVFTGSRVAEPMSVLPRVADVLGEMALTAGKEGVQLLVENEASCNIATCAELAALMKQLPSKSAGINWDAQNGVPHKEEPFPYGYSLLPKKRIQNVHVKAKGVMEGSPDRLDWKGIMQALQKDGYEGKIGLETHIFDGTLIAAANTSMKEILRIVGEL